MVIDTCAGKADELLILTAQLFKQLTHLQLTHAFWQLIVAPKAEVIRNVTV